MKHAFGYCRVSSKGQEKGHGIKRQKEIILGYCVAARIEIVEWFEDAHTGTEESRPAFEDMLARLLANGTRTVIVESMDRLAREVTVQGLILAKLCAEGVTLFAANTGENVTEAMQQDPMRKAMIQIQGVFAELDKSLVVRKLRLAREEKKRLTGRCEGRKPFGLIPGEERCLEYMLELSRRRGDRAMSNNEIAADLNQWGFTNRAGRPWTGEFVKKVLQRTRRRLRAERKLEHA